MNKIGDEANKRGIKFGYHNHNIEFATLANTGGLYEDFLIANTNPDKVFFEMDVYWISVGGQDPVAYLKNIQPVSNCCISKTNMWLVQPEKSTIRLFSISSTKTVIRTGSLNWKIK